MRHDPKYAQSQLAAVRQRLSPNNPLNIGSSMGQYTGTGLVDSNESKNYYYHHGNSVHSHRIHSGDWSASHVGHGYGHGYNGYGHTYNNGHHGDLNLNGGIGTDNGAGYDATVTGGGRVSALSEYENQDNEKQWLWLEDVLSNSKANKETVSANQPTIILTKDELIVESSSLRHIHAI